MLASARIPSSTSIAILLGAFTVAACSSGADTTGSGGSSSSMPTGGTGGHGASSSSSSGGGSDPECPPGPGYGGGEMPTQVDSGEAILVDLNGAPIPDSAVQLCGLDICLNGKTDANGHVFVPVNKMLTKPAFKFGDGFATAKLGILQTQAAQDFGTLVTGVFPATGAVLAAGKDVTSGDVTLNIAAGTTIVIDTLTYDSPDKQQFKSITIPTDKEMWIDPTLKIELLYGATPIETVFCPAVGVTVPNEKGWPAGTAVEFFLHGVDVAQEWAVYGGWTKVSDGQVSADGKTISTAAGGGLPALSAFGIRQKG